MGSDQTDPPDFVFKSSRGMFEYACKFMDCTLEKDRALPAFVGGPNFEGAVPSLIRINDKGIQQAMLTVISDDGGFSVIASTASSRGPKLQAGDMVMWMPMHFLEELADAATDKDRRFGWIGLILGTLELAHNYKKGWKIKERFLAE